MLTQPFADAIVAAEKIIRDAPHVRSEQDLAEGLDYLAGSIRASLAAAWNHEREFPFFMRSATPYMKLGLDNPDTLYWSARIRDDAEYVVTGRRGATADLSFQILNGDYTPADVPDSLNAFDDRAIEIDADGRFELRFGPAKDSAGPNYFVLGPKASQLLVREVWSDWTAAPGTIAIQRVDRIGAAPEPAGEALRAKRFESAGKGLVSQLNTFLKFPEWFYLKLPVNTMTEPRLTPGGLATQYSSAGHYELTDDEALIVTVPASDAPYQGFQLGTMWYISMDFVNHQTSLTADQAHHDPDGKLRFVVSRARSGARQLAGDDRARPRVSADPVAAHGARVRRGRRAAGREGALRRPAAGVAALRTGASHARSVARPDRGPPGRRGEQDAWDEGANVARGQDRRGHRDRPGTRPLDRDPVREGRRRRRAGVAHRGPVGRGRRRDQAARPARPPSERPTSTPRSRRSTSSTPRWPSSAGSTRRSTTRSRSRRSAPLQTVDFEKTRAGFETNVLGNLRMTRLFVPALTESRGNVVMINSSVLRHSSMPYGAYKMAKSALLALAQALATELGPQGIRVNSVAPGYIWADTLQNYFAYLGKKRGVERAGGLRRDRGQHGSAPAARSRRDRRCRGVHGVAHGPRHQRALPRRQLRRVPSLGGLR